ncbi:MAG: hypothetical protein M3203_01950 [Actinomycetota bacterium]|nr:hypothetical protein [Actinomycetota bacterium]
MTMTTTPSTDAGADESTLGCGCCTPPPDTVDKKLAELEARRQRLERRLARLT